MAELEDDALSASYLRGANLISRTTSATEYYTFNAHGDVVNLTNASGTSVKSYDYDAFGNEKDRVGSDPNPFRYCGEYFDVESGAYYLRARYYDPSVGRFTQEDAACFGLNWYAYCGNNPIRFHDSTGFHPEMISIDSDLDDEQIRLIFSNWEKFKTNKEIIDLIYKLSKVLNATAWGGLTSAVKIGNRAARKNYTFCDAKRSRRLF